MKPFKFSLVLRTRENTDVFITLDDNIYGIHRKRVNILYLFGLISHFCEIILKLGNWPRTRCCLNRVYLVVLIDYGEIIH